MSEMIERVARVLEPQAWAALDVYRKKLVGDTLAYRNRRTSSMRKARAAIEAMREPNKQMRQAMYREDWDGIIDAALSEKP